MPDQLELEWLAHERPQPLPVDAATTARVRSELLERRDSGARPRGSRRAGLRAWVWRGAAGGVTLAATAAAALAVIGVGGTSGAGVLAARRPPVRAHRAIASASARRLTHLSVELADDPVATGDATLVLRRQVYPNSPEIDGADLYADNGDYYYSPSLSGLPSVIQSGQTVNQGAADEEQREITAAKAALTEPVDEAREQMSVANYQPGVKPTMISPTSFHHELLEAASPEERVKLEQMFAKQAADNIQPEMSHDDGMIWDNGMDALLAGAGDPQVRAGVLKLFATVPQITVSNGTLGGQPTLELTAAVERSNTGIYQEQLVVDANSGVPLEMIGGTEGQTPEVTVYYTITRTTVSAVENGSAG